MVKKLSIIIVNYRGEKYIKNCLASVRDKFGDLAVREIIFVNNDEKKKLIVANDNYSFNIKIIDSGRNKGFGAGINLGAKEAQGEYLLFLNLDTEILSENIADILDKFKENKKIAIIGPRLVTSKGETQWWCAGKEFTFWRLFKNNLGIIESKNIWESKNEIFADWVSGGAMFVRKDVFEKLEGFDEKFFMYFEDEDLCRRARSGGYKILYSPGFTVRHFGGKGRDNWIKQKKQFFKSMLYYIKKYPHLFSRDV